MVVSLPKTIYCVIVQSHPCVLLVPSFPTLYIHLFSHVTLPSSSFSFLLLLPSNSYTLQSQLIYFYSATILASLLSHHFFISQWITNF